MSNLVLVLAKKMIIYSIYLCLDVFYYLVFVPTKLKSPKNTTGDPKSKHLRTIEGMSSFAFIPWILSFACLVNVADPNHQLDLVC